jgi:hypothetical protein
VELTEPPVVASPCRWVARSNSAQVRPPAARGAGRRIDRDRLELGQVDQDAAVAGAVPHDGVAAAADRDRQAGLAGEPDRCLDVAGAGRARDQRRMAVERAVPDAPGFGIALVAGFQQRAAEVPAQLPGEMVVHSGRHAGEDAPAGVPRPFLASASEAG